MNERYKISVVMPAYNVEPYVHQAVASILSQTWRNLEVLVMDDASTDNTLRVLHSITDPRLKVFRNEKNLGYLKTCNKLFDLADGEFIAFQDADDYADPVRFQLQMREFEKDPALGACGCNMTIVSQGGREMYCTNYFTAHDDIRQSILSGYYSMVPGAFVFKREILTTVGKYNEYFDRIGVEDYYWAWLIMEKYKLINIKAPAYYNRDNSTSVSRDLSDNRRKMHVKKLLPHVIRQRIETGTDLIEQRDLAAFNAFIDRLDEPYRHDPSLYFRELARRDFYSGHKQRAMKLLLKAIKQSPLALANYRDLLYYARTKTYIH